MIALDVPRESCGANAFCAVKAMGDTLKGATLENGLGKSLWFDLALFCSCSNQRRGDT